ncbi:MAG TPA: hypothetical protein VF377_08975 [Acidimicrobiia bacterium]
MQKIVYVTIPVLFVDDEPKSIDLADDGEPDYEDGGYWTFGGDLLFVDDEPKSIDLADDGEPGTWGDTWVCDDDYEDGGYWTFGGDLYSKAWNFVTDRLVEGS